MVAPYFYFYRKILALDSGPLNSARLRILFTCIVTFMVFSGALTVFFFFSSLHLLMYRMGSFFILFSIALYLFLTAGKWRHAAHFFLISVTLLIWTNVLLVNQSLYIINVQYGLLVIACSYYILGSRDGLRYAIAAILPLVADVISKDFLDFAIPSRKVDVNYTAYGITVAVNFLLFVYIHHLFFKSLNKFKKREASYKHKLECAVAHSMDQSLAKTNFVNTMSHEIRTPLNAIVGLSNLLISGDMTKAQQEDLKILNFSAQSLMATVNDIIDFNDLDGNKVVLKHKTFDISELLANICGSFKQEAAKKSLQFDYIVDRSLSGKIVNGDALRLSQILLHLVGNAIKFTEKGFVKVDVRALPVGKHSIAVDFTIADSGIGISKAELQQILDPFKKMQRRTQRQYQSTLGLTIAGHLVELHGTKLKIKSVAGRGSTFSFTITYELSVQLHQSKEPLKQVKNEPIADLRVLCVDDEKLNLMIVRRILARWGITPDEAENGKEAVDLCMTKSYDVILMDINMPIMDGFEASKAIKGLKDLEFDPPRIIALTASVGAAKAEVLKFRGIDDCILKPFDPAELKDKLDQLYAENHKDLRN